MIAASKVQRRRARIAALACAVISFLSFDFAQAAPGKGGPLGLGIVIGDPSAITGKLMFDAQTGGDVGLAIDVGRWFLVYADWLYHVNGAFGAKNEFAAHLTPYIGVGGLVAFAGRDWEYRRDPYYDRRYYDRYYDINSDSRFAIGVRVPLGLEWKPPQFPVGVFVEIVPGLVVLPRTGGLVQGGIGVRYFF